ncbi:MAG: pitrilysin family protein [Patescibacteria group bacterium]|nr:pitrilysin family protein [Patescibacteria group bacterium]
MFKKHTLKNGMRVLTVPSKATKAVTVLVLFKVGSRNESLKLNGASHFIEHLMFKGTKRRPTTLDISRELDGVGAEYNAFTGKDHTGYYIKISAEHTKLALDMLSDMLFHSKFDAKEMKREKGVILEELNMYRDNPMMHIEEIIEELVFCGNTLARPIGGTRESMIKMKREDVLTFKNKFYSPAKIVIGVAGCLDKGIMQMVEHYFCTADKSKKDSQKSFSDFIPTDICSNIKIDYKKTEQAQLALGFPSYGLGDKKLPALSLLSLILGGTMSSRLFTEVRERRGLAYYIRSQTESFEGAGAFVVRAGIDVARIDLAIKTILKELKKMRTAGVSSKELKRAKETVRGRLDLALEDSEALAAWFAKQELLEEKNKIPEEKLKEIYRVKVKDIKEVAQEVIKSQRLSLALIGPFKDKKRFEKILREAKL